MLLPLVPVTHRTRRRSASAIHRPRPPTTGMPAADSCATLGRYRDRPGVFTTTSQRWRAARPPSAVASTGRPSTGPACGGRRREPVGPQRQELAQVGVAFPAQAPDPGPCSGQVGPGELGPRAGRGYAAHRYRSGMKFLPTGSSMAAVSAPRRRVRPAGHLGREFLQQAGVAGRPAARPAAPRPGTGDLTDAFERLGARAEQRPELGLEPGVVQRLPGHGEDRRSAPAGRKGARIRSMNSTCRTGRTSRRIAEPVRYKRPCYSCGRSRGTG